MSPPEIAATKSAAFSDLCTILHAGWTLIITPGFGRTEKIGSGSTAIQAQVEDGTPASYGDHKLAAGVALAVGAEDAQAGRGAGAGRQIEGEWFTAGRRIGGAATAEQTIPSMAAIEVTQRLHAPPEARLRLDVKIPTNQLESVAFRLHASQRATMLH